MTEVENDAVFWAIQRAPTVYPGAAAQISTPVVPTIGWGADSEIPSVDFGDTHEPPRKKVRIEEAWKDHRQRRLMLEEERAKTESESRRAARKLRMELAEKLELGPNTQVYTWKENRNTGVREHNRVGKRKKRSTLKKYAPTQMLYSSFADEWDVCTAYDSDARKPDDSDSEVGWSGDEEDDYYPRTARTSANLDTLYREPDFTFDDPLPDFDHPFPPPDSHLPPPSNVADIVSEAQELSNEAWVQFFIRSSGVDYDGQLSPEEATDPCFNLGLTFLDIVQLRYGFHPLECLPPYENHSKTDVTKEFWKVRRLFMDNTSDYESDNEFLELHLQNYAYLFADAATFNVQTPRLSDLNPGHSRYLGNRPSSARVLERACLVDGRRISLYSVAVEGGVQEPWRLFIRDPMVAVKCLRWDFGSTMQIAKAFLSRGTPFYTAAETHGQVGQPMNNYSFRGLGLRNAEYEPDLADYIAYEAEVLQFVQSPRGRAVLKAGGLYWRIGVFVLQSANIPIESKFDILSGLSNDLGHAALSIKDVHDDISFVDDTLTELELEFLSGSFTKKTSECTFTIFVL